MTAYWSYGGSVQMSDADTTPLWSYGESVIKDFGSGVDYGRTLVDVLGVHWKYGTSKLLTSEHVESAGAGKSVTGDFDPQWYYGLSTLIHKLVEFAATGGRRKWLTAYFGRVRHRN
jgi:hypothetical protein